MSEVFEEVSVSKEESVVIEEPIQVPAVQQDNTNISVLNNLSGSDVVVGATAIAIGLGVIVYAGKKVLAFSKKVGSKALNWAEQKMIDWLTKKGHVITKSAEIKAALEKKIEEAEKIDTPEKSEESKEEK